MSETTMADLKIKCLAAGVLETTFDKAMAPMAVEAMGADAIAKILIDRARDAAKGAAETARAADDAAIATGIVIDDAILRPRLASGRTIRLILADGADGKVSITIERSGAAGGTGKLHGRAAGIQHAILVGRIYRVSVPGVSEGFDAAIHADDAAGNVSIARLAYKGKLLSPLANSKGKVCDNGAISGVVGAMVRAVRAAAGIKNVAYDTINGWDRIGEPEPEPVPAASEPEPVPAEPVPAASEATPAAPEATPAASGKHGKKKQKANV